MIIFLRFLGGSSPRPGPLLFDIWTVPQGRFYSLDASHENTLEMNTYSSSNLLPIPLLSNGRSYVPTKSNTVTHPINMLVSSIPISNWVIIVGSVPLEFHSVRYPMNSRLRTTTFEQRGTHTERFILGSSSGISRSDIVVYSIQLAWIARQWFCTVVWMLNEHNVSLLKAEHSERGRCRTNNSTTVQ